MEEINEHESLESSAEDVVSKEKKPFDPACAADFLRRAKEKIDESESLYQEMARLEESIDLSKARICEIKEQLANAFDEFQGNEQFAFISDIIATIDETITDNLVKNHKF